MFQSSGLAKGSSKRGASKMRAQLVLQKYTPNPWADPKSRSTLGFWNLHHRSIGVQNWGLYFLDPPGGLGRRPGGGAANAQTTMHSQDSSLQQTLNTELNALCPDPESRSTLGFYTLNHRSRGTELGHLLFGSSQGSGRVT